MDTESNKCESPTKRQRLRPPSPADDSHDNPSQRVKQSFFGTKHLFADRHKVNMIIISESWPSVLPCLQSLGCSNFHCFLGLQDKEQLSAYSKLFKLHFHPWSATNRTLDWQLIKQNAMVWIQGSSAFAAAVLGDFNRANCQISNLIVLVPSSRGNIRFPLLAPLTWETFTHAQCGGITLARWKVGYSLGQKQHPWVKGTNVQRTLHHVLQHATKGGKPCPPPSPCTTSCSCNPNRPVTTPSKRLRTGDSNPHVISPSVFSASGFVCRNLTPKELLEAYDLPAALILRLQLVSNDQLQMFLQHLTTQLPAKMSHFAASHLLHSGTTVEILDLDGGNINSSSPSPPLQLGKPPPPPIDDMILARDIAVAKADDAEAPIHHWDSHAATVYFGKYISTVHTPVFDLLRQVMLRKYRINIRRSFASYLKSTYGCLRLQDLPIGTNPHLRNELKSDLEVGRDALQKAIKASWWTWKGGSTLFFWRWPVLFRRQARDGCKIYVKTASLRGTDTRHTPPINQKERTPL